MGFRTLAPLYLVSDGVALADDQECAKVNGDGYEARQDGDASHRQRERFEVTTRFRV